MDTNIILFAMFFHVCWVVLLYVALTVLRAPTVWGVDTRSGAIGKLAALEPKVSANLSNQFEWPLLFYACCVLIISVGIVDPYQGVLAWVFILGRVIHSMVHIFTNNIRLRGALFTINFVAVFLMWVRLIVVMS